MSGLTPPHEDPHRRPPAGLGLRCLAHLIDLVFIGLALGALAFVARVFVVDLVGGLYALGDSPPPDMDGVYRHVRNVASVPVAVVGIGLYEWFFRALWGATPGMLILRLRAFPDGH